MRNEFRQAMIDLAEKKKIIFMTGDLGFNALEPLQQAMGERFINAGVAEQNMVSAAAGMAGEGHSVWIYSIAPFVYARPFEQIRNDICYHKLDVKLVGNGGGYGYGPMGATHHALEDYGVLLTLRDMAVMIPAFGEDLEAVVERMQTRPLPAYLRLGVGVKPSGYLPLPYQPWRRLATGGAGCLVAVGPLAGTLLEPLLAMDEKNRPSLWALCELPLAPLPGELLQDIGDAGRLCVAEEHVAEGGAGQALAHALALRGGMPAVFRHCFARGYPSGRFGSQQFHRIESGLDPDSILREAMA